jgi:PAS domain S-box-containing protein
MRAIDAAGSAGALSQTLARLVDDASDAVVVTDSSGRIQIANPAFVALIGVAGEAELKGRPLMNWVSLADQPLAALVAKVRRDGIARRIESWVRHGAAQPVQVDISAALLTEGDQECIGFTIRTVARSAKPPGFDAEAGDALSVLLRAGIEALGTRLDEPTLAALMRDAAALLGMSAEQLSQRALAHGSAPVRPRPDPSAA